MRQQASLLLAGAALGVLVDRLLIGSSHVTLQPILNQDSVAQIDTSRDDRVHPVPVEASRMELAIEPAATSEFASLKAELNAAAQELELLRDALREAREAKEGTRSLLQDLIDAACATRLDDVARFCSAMDAHGAPIAPAKLRVMAPNEVLALFGRPTSSSPTSWTWEWTTDTERGQRSGKLIVGVAGSQAFVLEMFVQ